MRQTWRKAFFKLYFKQDYFVGEFYMNEDQRFELLYQVGEELLKDGAELGRVETTVAYLAESFELQEFSCFIMINGIFMTCRKHNGDVLAKNKEVPLATVQLDKIDAINDLSRKLTAKKISIAAFNRQFNQIKQDYQPQLKRQFLAYCLGSASFCIIFNGTLPESFAALFLGLFMAFYLLILTPKLKLSKISLNISASFLVSILAQIIHGFFPWLKLSSLVIGGIIALVPGISIVNGIRYLFNEDYPSGLAQVTDALVISLCIAFGVGLALWTFDLL